MTENTEPTRRNVIKAAAWSAPVIAAAIATPLAAASQPYPSNPPTRTRLIFNTKNATDTNPWDPYLNANKPEIQVIVAAMDTTGGKPVVGLVTFVVVLTDSAGKAHTQTFAASITTEWGATPDKTLTFKGIAKGAYSVALTANAVGVTELRDSITGKRTTS